MEGLEESIKNCLNKVPASVKDNIKGISVDTTGSTPCLTDKNGTPLSLLPEFKDNPNAMFILWKDHTSVKETAEINKVAKTWGGEDFTKYEGGVYSSEWFWAKILHVFREDEKVRNVAYSAIELCDWIPAFLTGNNDISTVKRGRCSAGHKAMWHESWGGLPDEEFLVKIDPLLKGFKSRLYIETCTADVKAGTLSPEWAKKLDLSEKVVIGTGSFDAHMGAVGAGIEPYALVKIIGTSTCDILVASKEDIEDKLISGICGQVDGSVIPNMIGLEAGQSSFGDVYAWFKSLLTWPLNNLMNDEKRANDLEDKIIPALEVEARKIPIEESGIIAVDWFNGRRTPVANQNLKGAIFGLNLGSNAPRIYRALVESTAFGARAINEAFISQGVSIKQVIGIGGVVKKSDFIMQVLADVLNMPIKICGSDEVCALGAAMCAATAAGIYDTIEEAQKHMNSGFVKEYLPIPENAKKYELIYKRYLKLGKFVEEHIMNLIER
jgi:L-ribulokinase